MALVGLVPGGARGIPSAVGYFSLGALWQWDRHRVSQPVTYDSGVAPQETVERGQKSPEPELGEEEAADEPSPSTCGDWLAPEDVAFSLTGVHLAWCLASWTWRRRSARTTRGVIRRYVVPVDADATGVSDRRTLRRRSRVA